KPANSQVLTARCNGLEKTLAKVNPRNRSPRARALRSPRSVKDKSVRPVCWPDKLQAVSPCLASYMTGSASATILSQPATGLRSRQRDVADGRRDGRPRNRIGLVPGCDAAPQATAFDGLPNAERRQADCEIACPLQQREREPHFRRKPEGGAQQDI